MRYSISNMWGSVFDYLLLLSGWIGIGNDNYGTGLDQTCQVIAGPGLATSFDPRGSGSVTLIQKLEKKHVHDSGWIVTAGAAVIQTNTFFTPSFSKLLVECLRSAVGTYLGIRQNWALHRWAAPCSGCTRSEINKWLYYHQNGGEGVGTERN